jgi:hypothetical protein
MVGLIIFFVVVIGAAAGFGWYHSKELKETKAKIKVGLAFKMYHGDPFKWGWKEVQVVGVNYEYAQIVIHYIMPTGQKMYQEQISTRITDLIDTLTKNNIELIEKKED